MRINVKNDFTRIFFSHTYEERIFFTRASLPRDLSRRLIYNCRSHASRVPRGARCRNLLSSRSYKTRKFIVRKHYNVTSRFLSLNAREHDDAKKPARRSLATKYRFCARAREKLNPNLRELFRARGDSLLQVNRTVRLGALYLDHSRRRRTRGEIRGWHQVVSRSSPQSQQHAPMLLPGDRLGLHRDEDRAVLTVPSHEVHVLLRTEEKEEGVRDDKTRCFTAVAAITGAISYGF